MYNKTSPWYCGHFEVPAYIYSPLSQDLTLPHSPPDAQLSTPRIEDSRVAGKPKLRLQNFSPQIDMSKIHDSSEISEISDKGDEVCTIIVSPTVSASNAGTFLFGTLTNCDLSSSLT